MKEGSTILLKEKRIFWWNFEILKLKNKKFNKTNTCGTIAEVHLVEWTIRNADARLHGVTKSHVVLRDWMKDIAKSLT